MFPFKPLFCLLLITFLSATVLPAQDQQEDFPGFRSVRVTGIRAGANVASFGGSGSYYGFHGAFFGEMQTGRKLGYGAEVSFSNQGGYSDGTRVVLNYIAVPLLLNIYTGKFTWQAGGYGAFLLNARAKRNGVYADVTAAFRGMDAGLVAGFKLQAFSKVGVGLRYYAGLQKITTDSFLFSSAPENQNLQVSIIYNF